jgi:hypothetical protein
MELDPVGYYYVCYECGLMSNLKVLTTPACDYMVQFDDGDSQQVKTMPRACYPSGNHPRKKNANFENILQQFFGSVPRKTIGMKQYNKVLAMIKPLNIAGDPDAYDKIRALLKQNKIRGCYPLIFNMIYDLGGIKPIQAMIWHHRIRAEYGAAEYYHQQLGLDHSKKRSMPSAWMLLDFILNYLGCPSYYRLSVVANKQANKYVNAFLKGFETDILNKRTGLDIHQYKQDTGVWPIWADSQQLPKPVIQ